MKNNGPLKKYLYKSLAGAGSIIICILVFFAMYRFDQIVAAYNLMKGILMPFIYGAVIAYLLTPVCNFIERHLFCSSKAMISASSCISSMSSSSSFSFSYFRSSSALI